LKIVLLSKEYYCYSNLPCT